MVHTITNHHTICMHIKYHTCDTNACNNINILFVHMWSHGLVSRIFAHTSSYAYMGSAQWCSSTINQFPVFMFSYMTDFLKRVRVFSQFTAVCPVYGFYYKQAIIKQLNKIEG